MLRMGFSLRTGSFRSQLVTAAFQSHVCFSMSKASPDGQRMACRPEVVHWMTSRQLSSPDCRRNHSLPLPLHSSRSKLSSSTATVSVFPSLIQMQSKQINQGISVDYFNWWQIAQSLLVDWLQFLLEKIRN